MKLKNQIMLITYANSMGRNLRELNAILDRYFKGVIGGLHILPFYPSSADRGFAPRTYRIVDPVFGNWEDVIRLGKHYDLMLDYMVNHISRQSEYFQDFLHKKEESKYKDLFIQYREFWPYGEPTDEDIARIYKRKLRAPYIEATFDDGSTEKIWCTFDEEQIDLNWNHEVTKDWSKENLAFLASQNAAVIRLDAFAYATKKIGTNCFFVEPDIWRILEECEDAVKPLGCDILPEIHEHYTIQLRVAEKNYYVYDFALPMLLLHGLYTGRSDRLLHWLRICPRKQFTTLDTHDGIGVVDVKDLMSDEEIEMTRDRLYAFGGSVNRKYSTSDYNNLDIYQINSTYFSALGENEDAYLTARAIQFFAPGIPQVYYVGLMAGKNDVALAERTKNGRDINRHYYSRDEISTEHKRPILQKLYHLMIFRNRHPAFDGQIEINDSVLPGQVQITWKNDRHMAELTASLFEKRFIVKYTDEDCMLKELRLDD